METLTKSVPFICFMLYVVAAAPRSLFNSNDINFETYTQKMMCPPCFKAPTGCSPTILEAYHISNETCQTCMAICHQRQQISVMDEKFEEEKVRTKRSVIRRRRAGRRRFRKFRRVKFSRHLKPVDNVQSSNVVNIKPNINSNNNVIYGPQRNIEKPPNTTPGNAKPGNVNTNTVNSHVKNNSINTAQKTSKHQINIVSNSLLNVNVGSPKEKIQSSNLVSPDITNELLATIIQTVNGMETNSSTQKMQSQDKVNYNFPISNSVYDSAISNTNGKKAKYRDKVQTPSVKTTNEILFMPVVGDKQATKPAEHNNQIKNQQGTIDEIVWSILHSVDHLNSKANKNQIKQTDVNPSPIIEPTKTSKNKVSDNVFVENVVSSVVDAVNVQPSPQSQNNIYDSGFVFEPLKPIESSKDRKKKELQDKKKKVVFKQVRQKFHGILLPLMKGGSPSAKKQPLPVMKKLPVKIKKPRKRFRHNYHGLPILSINNSNKGKESSSKLTRMYTKSKYRKPISLVKNINNNLLSSTTKSKTADEKKHKSIDAHHGYPVLSITTGNLRHSRFKPQLHLTSEKVRKMKEEHKVQGIKSSYLQRAAMVSRKPRKMIIKRNRKLKHIKPAHNTFFGLPVTAVNTKNLKPISRDSRTKQDMVGNNLQTIFTYGIYHRGHSLGNGAKRTHHSSKNTKEMQKKTKAKPKTKSPYNTNNLPTLAIVSNGINSPAKSPKKVGNIATNMLRMGPMRRHRGNAMSFGRLLTRRKMPTRPSRKEKISRRHAQRTNTFGGHAIPMHPPKPQHIKPITRHNTRQRSMSIKKSRENVHGTSTTKSSHHRHKTPQKRRKRKRKTHVRGLAIPFGPTKHNRNNRPLMIRNSGRHQVPILRKSNRNQGIALPGTGFASALENKQSTRFPREQRQNNYPEQNDQYPGMDFVKRERLIDFSPPNFEEETVTVPTYSHLLETDDIISSVIDAVQGDNSVPSNLLMETNNRRYMTPFANSASDTQKTTEEYVQKEPEVNNANVNTWREIMSEPSAGSQLTVATTWSDNKRQNEPENNSVTNPSSNTATGGSTVDSDIQPIGDDYPTEFVDTGGLTYKTRLGTSSSLQQKYESIAGDFLRLLINKAINMESYQSNHGGSHTNNVNDNNKSETNKNYENYNSSSQDDHSDNANSGDHDGNNSDERDRNDSANNSDSYDSIEENDNNSNSEEGGHSDNANSSDHDGNSSDERDRNDSENNSDSYDSIEENDNNSNSEEGGHSDNANSSDHYGNSSDERDRNDSANNSDSYDSIEENDNNSNSEEGGHGDNANSSDHDGNSSDERDRNDSANSGDSYDSIEENGNNSNSEEGGHSDNANSSDHDGDSSGEGYYNDNAKTNDREGDSSSNEDDSNSSNGDSHNDRANSNEHDDYDISDEDNNSSSSDHSDNANRSYHDGGNSSNNANSSDEDDNSSNEDDNSNTANSNDHNEDGDDSDSNDSDNNTDRHKRTYDGSSSESSSNSDSNNSNDDNDSNNGDESNDSNNDRRNKRSTDSDSHNSDKDIDRHKRSYESSSSESSSNSDSNDSDNDNDRQKRSYDSSSSESSSSSDSNDTDNGNDRHKRSYDSSSSEGSSNSDSNDSDDNDRHKRSYDSSSSESSSSSDSNDTDNGNDRHKRSYDCSSIESTGNSDSNDSDDNDRHKRSHDSSSSESSSNSESNDSGDDNDRHKRSPDSSSSESSSNSDSNDSDNGNDRHKRSYDSSSSEGSSNSDSNDSDNDNDRHKRSYDSSSSESNSDSNDSDYAIYRRKMRRRSRWDSSGSDSDFHHYRRRSKIYRRIVYNRYR